MNKGRLTVFAMVGIASCASAVDDGRFVTLNPETNRAIIVQGPALQIRQLIDKGTKTDLGSVLAQTVAPAETTEARYVWLCRSNETPTPTWQHWSYVGLVRRASHDNDIVPSRLW